MLHTWLCSQLDNVLTWLLRDTFSGRNEKALLEEGASRKERKQCPLDSFYYSVYREACISSLGCMWLCSFGSAASFPRAILLTFPCFSTRCKNKKNFIPQRWHQTEVWLRLVLHLVPQITKQLLKPWDACNQQLYVAIQSLPVSSDSTPLNREWACAWPGWHSGPVCIWTSEEEAHRAYGWWAEWSSQKGRKGRRVK